jgi:hypothetical protein
MVYSELASIPFVALTKSAEAGRLGANMPHTVRTACEGTTEKKTPAV